MRKILITGGTGTVGRGLIGKLLMPDVTIRLLTLPGDPNAEHLRSDAVEIVYGDIADPEIVNGLCQGIDTVIHCAAVILSEDENQFDRINVTGTRYLLVDARNWGVQHFVYISSASVVYRKMTHYSRSKRIAERYVKESGVPWTIIRPTLVFGATGGIEFDIFLKKIAALPIVPLIGSGNARKRPVFIDDLVAGIVAVAQRRTGTGKIYNLSGATIITMIDFTRLCRTLLGKENTVFIPVPVCICQIMALVMKKMMKKPLLTWNMIAGAIQNADIDPYEAKCDLGFAPVGFQEKIGSCFPRKATEP